MPRYSTIKKIKAPDGERIYKTVRYPEIPRSFEDIYVYTTAGDRYDTLATQYYGDPSLWWIISNANGTINQNSLIPPIGSQIRIPSNPTPSLAVYRDLNQ